MKEFKINNYIALKLVEDETVIYVNGEKFDQCKFLFLTIPVSEIELLEDVETIDEIAEKLNNTLERVGERVGEPVNIRIDPRTEFWAHCSNLQAWWENNYDTRLLHSNLAFPLLKKLSEIGDSLAKKVFKEEIAKRLEMGNSTTVGYLSVEGFLSYLSKEEFISVFEILCQKFNMENFVEKLIETRADRDYDSGRSYFLEKIQETMPEYFKSLVRNLLEKSSAQVLKYLIDSYGIYIKNLSQEEFWSSLIDSEELIVIKELEKELGREIKLFGEILHIDFDFALRAFTVEKKKVTGLALQFCELKNVPELIRSFKNLKVLDLKGNKIIDLSKSMEILKNLHQLEVLKLHYNRLEILPENFGEISSLKELNLRDNKLTVLPDSFENLKALEILALDDNRLKSVPVPIYNLTSLRRLLLQDNRFIPNIQIIKGKMKNKTADLEIIK